MGSEMCIRDSPAFWGAVLITLAVSYLILPIGALLAVAAISFGVMGLAKRQIGGQTGDVLGATQKLTECAAWLALAA